jgi:hypothetical protein
MVDLQETPAVPPTDFGGDERFGLHTAGAVLIGVGWAGALVLNLLFHAVAPSQGWVVYYWRIYPHPGPIAVGVAILGFFTGLMGLAMILLAREEPDGPLVLPGFDYSDGN